MNFAVFFFQFFKSQYPGQRGNSTLGESSQGSGRRCRWSGRINIFLYLSVVRCGL